MQYVLVCGWRSFAFTVILPHEGEFDAFDASFDPATLSGITTDLTATDIRLWLPSFSFDFSASLADTLKALGMEDAFDPNRANFSGMVDGIPPEPLVIADVLHKAFIDVNEHGTEAAAATVVIMEAATAMEEPEEPIELRLDRPFLFAIRDTKTGTLLFLGRLLTPEA